MAGELESIESKPVVGRFARLRGTTLAIRKYPHWNQLRLLADGIVRFIYPPICMICQTPDTTSGICSACEAKLCANVDALLCPRCAATAGPYAHLVGGCHLCRKETFAFQKVIRLGSYQGLLNQVCLSMKKFGRHIMATSLAELLYRHRTLELKALKSDFVVPIPLHWTRRFSRGFDQAELLAESIAGNLKLPFIKGKLVRRLRTIPQATLTPTDRRSNVRNAFRAKAWPKWKGASVLLVDDVLTTGATCHNAARALKQAGVKRVDVVVLARGEAAR